MKYKIYSRYDPSKVVFEGDSLHGANLQRADLRGANLRSANLIDANLRGANLEYTELLSFTLGKHFGWAHFGEQYEEGSYVRIGCRFGSLKWWLSNYEEVGKEAHYPDKTIELYGDQLRLLEKHYGV